MRFFIPIIALLFVHISINAQIFVKQNAAGNNTGTSWTDAFTNLQPALDVVGPGNQIWIAAGTYIPDGPSPDSSHFILNKAVELYGGFAGTESNLGERDFQVNLTIMSGDRNGDDTPGDYLHLRSDNAHHIFVLDAGLSDVTLDGLVFKGGSTRLDAYMPDSTDLLGIDRWRGGAVFIRNSPSVIRNCSFIDNNGYQGSAFFARNSTSNDNILKIENSKFESNSVLNGGIGAAWPWNHCFVSHCVFQQNLSGNYSAGLVIINSNASIEDCSFNQNFASQNGGACFFTINPKNVVNHPSIQFVRCSFTGNTSGSTGGAFQLVNYSFNYDLTFDSCTFSKNSTLASNSQGGAIYIRDYSDELVNELSSNVRINHSTFAENSSGYGGAFEIATDDDSLNIDIIHSGFIKNTCATDGYGGGVYITLYNTPIVQTRIEETVFDGNESSYGGGITLEGYFNIHPMLYTIDSCIFSNNISAGYGGAININTYQNPGPIGSILNSQFLKNEGFGASGAIDSYLGTLHIENCHFAENYTQGNLYPEFNGGGAITLAVQDEATVRNCIFEKNISDNEGAAVFIYGGENNRFENVLFKENSGNSTIFNGGNLHLLNSTIVDNELGLILKDSSTTEIQNSIFKNNAENMLNAGFVEINSKGGNISSDGSMSAVLTGYGDHNDLNNTDPMLGPDFIPANGSPCIDAGNPDGVMSEYDLAGNTRIQGNGIDIGAFESFTVAVKNAVWDASILNVFPNPVKDVLNFNLESDWTGEMRVIIYNNLGQPVHKTLMTKSSRIQSFTENLNRLTTGEYVVLVEIGKTIYATNIIIQR